VNEVTVDLQIIVGLVLVAALVYYFRQVQTSQKNKKRIVDLLLVGVVLWLTPSLCEYINYDPFKVSGILIFAYGWGVFIIEKFWEGLEEETNPHNGSKRSKKG
jgi:RsiW-degrading membrane proteinase PrsW (M82 family)